MKQNIDKNTYIVQRRLYTSFKKEISVILSPLIIIQAESLYVNPACLHYITLYTEKGNLIVFIITQT